MAILKNRIKLQLRSYNHLKPNWLWFKQAVLGFGVCAAILFMYDSEKRLALSRTLMEINGLGSSKILGIYQYIADTYDNAHRKLDHLRNIEAEVIALKLELSRMQRAQKQIEQLKLDNSKLQKLLNYSEQTDSYAGSARLLTVSSSAFGNTAIIDRGSNNGIGQDQIITSNDSIVGRVVEVSPYYSRVMLATDFNSRIPVITAISNERGILAGDNISAKVLYIQNPSKIIIGETIMTSGDGMVYPVGINISSVKEVVNDVVLIEPINHLLNTQFVAVHKKLNSQ